MNCSECKTELETYKEMDWGMCEECYRKSYMEHQTKAHNSKVESKREDTSKLTAHQKRLIALMKQNPEYILSTWNDFNSDSKDECEILKPIGNKEYGYQEYETIKRMTVWTGYDIEDYLYIVSAWESDDGRSITYSYYEEKQDDES